MLRNIPEPQSNADNDNTKAIQSLNAARTREADNKNGRWRFSLVVAAATILSSTTLGLLCYDTQLGLTVLGGVAFVAAAIAAGVYISRALRPADVMVRVDGMEVHIRITNAQRAEKQTSALLIDLADYTLRQLQSQPPSYRKK